jgi:AbrB family looped-hinge helix DNA binding protein
MSTKRIGPKGQVLIPNQIREALGLQPGVEVNIEMKGEEVIITRPRINGSYTEYYTQTRAPKLRKQVDMKKLVLEEGTDRFGVP